MCAAVHFTSDTTRVLVCIQFVILNCICPSYDFFFHMCWLSTEAILYTSFSTLFLMNTVSKIEE